MAFFRLQGIEPVTDTTRALNKRFGNQAMMRLAGGRYFFAGVIRQSCSSKIVPVVFTTS